MSKSLHQMTSVLSLTVILAVNTFVSNSSEKLTQTLDVMKKVAEQLGIEEKDLILDAMDSHE